MSWERKVQKKSAWSSSTLSPRESLFKTQGFSKPVEEPVEKTALKPIQFRGRDTSHLDHIKVNSDRPIVTPRVNLSNLQTKLTVGAPGDKYEQEADSMAQKVMSTPDSAVQRMTPGEEEEVRAKPLAANITPLVQREEMPQEEKEEVQAKSLGNGTIQREEMPEEKEEVQAKPLGNGTIQREEMPEEKEELQAKPLGNGTIQLEEMPEEKDELQTKPLLQRKTDGSFQAGGNIESQLNSSKGGGSPLADNVRGFMEPRFGADFSSVRVHTGDEAVQMNRELGAQAFTHGSDVYFGAGKASGNNELTAHELTHVVQQVGASQLQRKPTTVAKTWGWREQVPNQPYSEPPMVSSGNYIGGEIIQRKTKAKAATPAEIKQAKEDYTKFTASNYTFPKFTTGKSGKFDVDYQAASKLVDITVKVKFEFPDIKEAWIAKLVRQIGYTANYISQVQKAWSGRYSFKNVREPQAVWGKLNPTLVQVNVVPVKTDEHFLIQAYLNKSGTANVSGGNMGASNKTELYKGDDTSTPRFNPGTGQGELQRIKRINPSPIRFGNGSFTISATDKNKLNFLATYLKRINNPIFDIDIIGHATNTGFAANSQKFSEQRARAVETELQSAGLTNHNLKTNGVGSTGATADAQWRKVDITPNLPTGWQNIQDVTVHEFGHMVGLGDEYGGTGVANATHYPLVVKAFGKEYADQVAKRGDTDYASIMEGGNDVRIQHYVTFWEALCETTLKKATVPTKKFGYDDWKFIG
jgi:outer membrane protein OmpA-like peptidoglycan-associated protein